MLDKTKFYIDGRWVAPIDGTDFPVINPATEDAFATISLGGQKDAEAAIAAAVHQENVCDTAIDHDLEPTPQEIVRMLPAMDSAASALPLPASL